MAKIFYLSEILNFAIEREQESIDLYQNLFNAVKDEEAKTLFQRLVGEEKKHKEIYTKMLASVKSERSPGAPANEEYDAYMRELIFENRTTPPLTLGKMSDILSALDYAIAREKDSVLFYVGLRKYVPEADLNQIEIIIKEEGKHMALLADLRKNL